MYLKFPLFHQLSPVLVCANPPTLFFRHAVFQSDEMSDSGKDTVAPKEKDGAEKRGRGRPRKHPQVLQCFQGAF